MKIGAELKIRIERQPHREAVRRLRQVYYKLQEAQKGGQEDKDDQESSPVCSGVDTPTGAGSDH